MLDLDDIGAVVTVDAVDTATHTLTVTVEFVEPSSQYHEITLGVDGVLDLGCDGGGAGAPATARVGRNDSAVLRLAGVEPGKSTVDLAITCASGGDSFDDDGACTDSDNGAVDFYGDDCDDWYDSYPDTCGSFDDDDFSSDRMCCACGGGSQAPPYNPIPVTMYVFGEYPLAQVAYGSPPDE